MTCGSAGEPIFGVYPPSGGREPSFPNPTANLVSTKREQLYAKGGLSPLCFACFAYAFFVLLVFRQHFFVLSVDMCFEFTERWKEQ